MPTEPPAFNPEFRPGFKEALDQAYTLYDNLNPTASQEDRIQAHHRLAEALKQDFPTVAEMTSHFGN